MSAARLASLRRGVYIHLAAARAASRGALSQRRLLSAPPAPPTPTFDANLSQVLHAVNELGPGRRDAVEAWLAGMGLFTLDGFGRYLYLLEGPAIVALLTQTPWSLDPRTLRSSVATP